MTEQNSTKKLDNGRYDEHGNAKHYDELSVNAFFIFENCYGTNNTALYFEMTALKYRIRIGRKGDEQLELAKIKWYERAAEYLRNKPEDQKIEGSVSQKIPKEITNV